MAVVSEVPFSQAKTTGRIDAEYYQPHLLQYEREVASSGLEVLPLGALIHGGYRVIYENTEIIDEPLPSQNTVGFLQAANIQAGFPTIDLKDVGRVSFADWERYPKGRIRRGEMLIEVKGKASKVAIVPEDYPLDTLVTGTVYKFLVDEQKVNRFYLLAYLLSEYGCGFRHRCLTNTLVGFVSKEELYRIPVPIADESYQAKVADLMQKSFSYMQRSVELYSKAESLLLSELGIENLDLKPTLSYERNFSESQEAHRADAEYFQPKYYAVLKKLNEASTNRASEKIGNLSAPLKYGTSDKLSYIVAGVPFLRIADLENLRFEESSVLRISAEEARGQKTARVASGDVLISRSGTLGLTVAIPHQLNNAIYGSYFIRLRPKIDLVHPEFLALYMNSIAGALQVERLSTGGVQTNLTISAIENIIVVHGDMQWQQRFVRNVRKSVAARDEARRTLEQAKQMIHKAVQGGEA